MTTTTAPTTAEEKATSVAAPITTTTTTTATITAPSQQTSSTGLPMATPGGVPPSPRLRQISATSAASVARRPSSSLSDARDPSSSRRHSEQRMLPPPAPLTQPPFAQPPSPGGSIRSVSSISGSDIGVGSGPGPTRLPHQLSPAEIYAEVEKEQEAAVNRLTRQLSILRAQQTMSPTSHPISDDLSGTYPSTYLSPRSRRTSSNASTALTNAATIGSTMAGSSLSRQSSIQSLSAARGDPTAASAPVPTRPAPIPMSRQSSVRSISGSRASGRNSPALGESDSPYPYFGSQYYYASPHAPLGSSSWKDNAGMAHLHNHHHSRERERAEYAGSEAGGSERGLGVSYSSSAGGHPRYEEVLTARNELENVKKENEKLKEKIRELEKALSGVNVTGTPSSEKEKETKPETDLKSGEP
ncbi:hypothetical protein TWF173_006805 [Orbilia oligospora]|uniref:Uncharacterized protein n=2 Tax=Orbilia oligospora TaxID=2813651 RepID=G1XJJ3_ARTOA|nr:hypothetical protein AOL_s00097g520 [Orbilia oligospora ATCC 24927]EGX46616.1 hypothetical protein AOL_s00097g520 [Orbilia oligospora ATCC 24927]KAF3288345.1 hypothetical protein TWF970_005422 [Orbilia oligospora]KAF3312768.1 hypothetical protein TWF173_006805 [Orbilia oligospora]